MRDFKAEADLFRIFQIDLPITDHDETRRIRTGMIHAPLDDVKPVCLCRMRSGDCRLRDIFFLRNLSRRERIVLHRNMFPLRMHPKEMFRLHQGLRV